MKWHVLYEDNHLIAVFKPAGLLTQADFGGDSCLMDEIKEYLKEKYHKPGNVFLGMLHRLDRPVSGIVLFAKTSKGASRLSEQFRNRTIQKEYQALVFGHPKPEKGTLIHYLKKNLEENRADVSANIFPGALRAELDYCVLSKHGGNAKLLLQPKTGRPHQIRAQLAAIDHPILGDVKYGASRPWPDKSVALCATRLIFQTATTKEKVEVKADPPANWVKFVGI